MRRNSKTDALDSPLPWLASASPLVKIALWQAATFAVVTLVQLAAWALSLQTQVFGDSARSVLLPVSWIGLVVLTFVDRRPLADFGLALTDRWASALGIGFAVGFAACGGWYALCYAIGVMQPLASVDWWHGVRLVRIVPAAFLLAVAMQIIFSGYILSIFRERYGRATAVVAAAVLLPLLYYLDAPKNLLSGEARTLVVGLLLIQALMGVIRLYSGHVMLSTGLLAGLILARNIVKRTYLLSSVNDAGLEPWFCPGGDPRRAPVVWALLMSCTIVMVLLVRHRGASPAAPRHGLPTSLKRVYPFAMPMCMASLGIFLICLMRARWRIDWIYWPRLVSSLILSAFNTVLSLPERMLAPLICRRVVPDPVFILGVHRSGTTHLHNLLALDPRLIAPRNYQALNPMGAWVCGWPTTVLLALFFPWRRPMDAMAAHVLSTNEEEFAIANQCRLSPYWGWVFAKQGARYDRYLFAEGFSPREKAVWRRANLRFLRKLVFWSGRRPVLKNPCNTGRLSMVLEMFPDARIIHLHRHPCDVYRSNLHLAREGQVLFQLQHPTDGGSYEERFLDNYLKMELVYAREAAELSRDRVVEVRFEELVRDPVGQVRQIYRQLGLTMDARFRMRLRRYLRSIAGYRKNKFEPLQTETRREVCRAVEPLCRRWGYHPDTLPDTTADGGVSA